MKPIRWLDALFISVSFVLLLIVDFERIKEKERACVLDEDDYSLCSPSFVEMAVLIYPKLHASFANNFVDFLQAVFIMFKNIFVEKDVSSVTNVMVLLDIFNSGHEAQHYALEMVYLVIGRPEEEYEW